MLSAAQQRALDAAHKPASRKKAVETLMRLGHHRARLAKKYGVGAREFGSAHLLATVERLHIPLASIPAELFKPFKPALRAQLLARRAANGHAGNGIGIPLDAIPAKKPKAEPGTISAYKRAKGHPNGELIGKLIDRLADPKITEKVAQRLIALAEKLVMG